MNYFSANIKLALISSNFYAFLILVCLLSEYVIFVSNFVLFCTKLLGKSDDFTFMYTLFENRFTNKTTILFYTSNKPNFFHVLLRKIRVRDANKQTISDADGMLTERCNASWVQDALYREYPCGNINGYFLFIATLSGRALVKVAWRRYISRDDYGWNLEIGWKWPNYKVNNSVLSQKWRKNIDF